MKAKTHFDLTTDLSAELCFLSDLLELAQDRANNGKDGKLVTLFDVAMPKLKRARELSGKLEFFKQGGTT